MGSNGQIFASFLVEKTVFNHIKHIIILKETPEMGSLGALNLHLITEVIKINDVMNLEVGITKY